jgi:hypothetical protein
MGGDTFGKRHLVEIVGYRSGIGGQRLHRAAQVFDPARWNGADASCIGPVWSNYSNLSRSRRCLEFIQKPAERLIMQGILGFSDRPYCAVAANFMLPVSSFRLMNRLSSCMT